MIPVRESRSSRASIARSNTCTSSSIQLTFPVFSFFFRGALSTPLLAPQHRRSFVFKVLVKELSIRSIMIRWCYPFPWYDAWESYAYTGGAIDPAWGGPASELFAEVGGEVVAILCEKVIRGALKLVGTLERSAHCQSHKSSGRVPL